SYLERSRTEIAAIQDPFLESRVLSSISSVLLSQGELAAARSRAEEALALGRKIGNRNAEGRALHNLAAVLVWEGKLNEASRLAERSYGFLKDGDPIEAGSALAVWADATARLGDLPGARRHLEEALALKQKANDRIAVARLRGSLAKLQLLEGDLAAARKTSAGELRTARGIGSRPLLAWSLQVEAAVLNRSDSMPGSRRSLEAALAASESTGETLRTMLIRGDLARALLSLGDNVRAADLAETVSTWCRERGNSWCEADAKATEANALASEGRKPEA
ncbi:MAG: tetratricopeptide repeat protein, partial [Acidobacteriota bacterium]